jgi:DNA-binding NtrC family response regulator
MPAISPRCAQPRWQRRYADPPGDQATATILVVDDDPRNPYAMDLLRVRPDVRLLFTDIMMPGMSGTTLAAEALKQRPDIKVLYATGCDGYVSKELAATELLRKPYRAHELAHRIRTVLERG